MHDGNGSAWVGDNLVDLKVGLIRTESASDRPLCLERELADSLALAVLLGPPRLSCTPRQLATDR